MKQMKHKILADDISKDWSKVIKIKKALGEFAITKNMANQLCYRLNFKKELSTQQLSFISQLIRDTIIEKVIFKRNSFEPKSKKVNMTSKKVEPSKKVKVEEIDLLEGCNKRTRKIIHLLVDEFGFNPMGFDVDLKKKLQRKGHQDIYYMGKHISNNRITRLLEAR